MNNLITWLLIADASEAKIFSTHTALLFQNDAPENLKLVGKFNHAESRMKGIDLKSDRAGGLGSGTFNDPTQSSPKRHEAEVFAHELLSQLETARKENHYRDLIIVAPPEFMGMLHAHMPRELNKLVSKKIEKDYTRLQNQELIKNLKELI